MDDRKKKIRKAVEPKQKKLEDMILCSIGMIKSSSSSKLEEDYEMNV